jgi:hypothetical protein
MMPDVFHLTGLVTMGGLLLVSGCALGLPAARILRRTGLSPWWSFLVLVPYVNVAALWVFAFARWPSERDAAGLAGLPSRSL